jgi:hypothetical protein
MIEVDTSWQRIELTGPWAGFGFQAGHLWTPENYELHPQDMRWWSLTCNIAREWRLMMDEQRGQSNYCTHRDQQSSVIQMRDVLMSRLRRHESLPGNRALPLSIGPAEQATETRSGFPR